VYGEDLYRFPPFLYYPPFFNFEKRMIYMKILKKGGVVEKRGEEETKSMLHAPVFSFSF
jgi:hypothetical protein